MKRNAGTVLVAAWGLCFAAAAVGSDEQPSLEQLIDVEIEGASRYAQPLTEAPATSAVIGARDITRYGYRTIAEALDTVRGVYATNDYAYSYLGVRGFSPPGDYNSRLLLMVDGARYNDGVYNQAMLGDEAPVDVAWIKRLEFVSGPASALYGGNALFGVANAMLWSGADIDGMRVDARLGKDGQRGGGLLAGRAREDGGDWIAGISVEHRDGADIAFPEFAGPGSDGVARGLDGEHWVKAFARYNDSGWRFTANISSRDKDVPTAYYGTDFGVPGNYVRDRQAHGDVVYSAALTNDWTQFARVHLGAYAYDAEYVYAGARSRDEAYAQWWETEYRLGYAGWKDHHVQVGADFRRNGRMEQRYFELMPRVDHLDDRHSENTLGLYAQDEWRFAAAWTLQLDLRLDHTASAGNIGSPRLAMIYRPQPGTSAKMIYGKAFRVPNAYERYYTDGTTQKVGTGLDAERIETTELTVDHIVAPGLRVGAGTFRNRMTDVISLTVDPADGMSVFTNQPALVARGWEFETEAQFGAGWRARGNWTWLHTDAYGAPVYNSPSRIGKLLVDGPLGNAAGSNPWIIAVEVLAISSRMSTAGTVPGHATGNLSLSQNAQGPTGRWSIDLRNIGDVHYAIPVGAEFTQTSLPQPGREWRLRWSCRL